MRPQSFSAGNTSWRTCPSFSLLICYLRIIVRVRANRISRDTALAHCHQPDDLRRHLDSKTGLLSTQSANAEVSSVSFSFHSRCALTTQFRLFHSQYSRISAN